MKHFTEELRKKVVVQHIRDGKTWTNSSASQTTTIKFTAQSGFNGRLYRCVISDGTDTVASNLARVAVN